MFFEQRALCVFNFQFALKYNVCGEGGLIPADSLTAFPRLTQQRSRKSLGGGPQVQPGSCRLPASLAPLTLTLPTRECMGGTSGEE